MVVAIYAGTFDPITNGHMDILNKALAIADKVVVAIGVHPSKTTLFSFEERKALIEAAARDAKDADVSRLVVLSFNNLLVEKAKEVDAAIILRGLRDGSDFDFEMQMAGMNSVMAPSIQTLFVPASAATRHITSTLVKQIAAFGGDVSPFVAQNVAQALKKATKS